MKKLWCLLMVLVMLVVNCAAGYCETEEDDDPIVFEAPFTNILDKQAKEWFSSSLNRALLTVMMALDFAVEMEDDEFDVGSALAKSSYVGKDGATLIVYFHGEDEDVMLFYSAITGEAAYTMRESTSDTLVELALEAASSDGCYENDIEDIVIVVEALSEIVE